MWSEQVLPRLTDIALRGHAVGELRAEACTGLAGRLLEIGFGSGLNVRWYPNEVTDVHAVEPSDVAWQLSERRRARTEVPVVRTGLDGQRIEAEDGSYDCVLTTFTLCSIPQVPTALAELRRLLRPGGRVHFLEHGLSPDPRVARWQRRLEPLQRRFAGGCHLTRDVPALVVAAGFELDDVRQDYLLPGATRAVGYTYLGRAVR